MLLEGIRYQDNQVVFDFKNDKADDAINLKLKHVGKLGTFYTKQSTKVDAYFSYSLKSKIDDETKKIIRDAIKNKSNINQSDYELFLTKGILGLKKDIGSKFDEIDLILTPKSSSTLARDIAEKFKAKLPNAIIATDSIIKNSLDGIKVDVEGYLNGITDKKELSKRKSRLKSDWKDSTSSGEFKIKEVWPARRHLYSNYLIFKTGLDRKIFNAINNGTVLIIDDYLTSGQSFKEMFREINNHKPAQIIAYALIKS